MDKKVKDISFHERESTSGIITAAVGFITAMAVVIIGGTAAIQDPSAFKDIRGLNKVSEWKEEEKSRRHIDNLTLVDHWGLNGKTKIYVDKSGEHIPFDSIERDSPAKEKAELSEKDRAWASSMINNLIGGK